MLCCCGSQLHVNVQVFDIPSNSCLNVSAKTGAGLSSVLPAVVKRVRPPPGNADAPLRLLLFDAYHDDYRGVVCLVEVVDGALCKGDRIVAASSGEAYEALEVRALPIWS